MYPELGILHIIGKAYNIDKNTVNRLVAELEYYMELCKELQYLLSERTAIKEEHGPESNEK